MFRKSSKIKKPAKIGGVSCGRCGGTGIFHIFGTCYRCGGNGSDPTNREWVFPSSWSDDECAKWNEAREARNSAARARAAKRREDREAARKAAAKTKSDAFIDSHDGLAEALETDHHIVRDIAAKIERFGDTSEKAVALVFKLAKEAEEREAARKVEAANSDHIGTEGERRTFSGTVEKIITYRKTAYSYFDSETGYITIVDVEGSKVKYFGELKVRGKDEFAEEGDEVTFDAMVKKHGDWKGVKETVVSRPTKLVINRGASAPETSVAA